MRFFKKSADYFQGGVVCLFDDIEDKIVVVVVGFWVIFEAELFCHVVFGIVHTAFELIIIFSAFCQSDFKMTPGKGEVNGFAAIVKSVAIIF